MTFSYNIVNDIGKVRFELGDGVSGTGVRADGSNFTDEEIQMLLTREGSVNGAVAASCEMLSRDWAKIASISVGSRSEQLGNVAAEWASRAGELRDVIGGRYATYSIGTKRVDGYSEFAEETV